MYNYPERVALARLGTHSSVPVHATTSRSTILWVSSKGASQLIGAPLLSPALATATPCLRALLRWQTLIRLQRAVAQSPIRYCYTLYDLAKSK